MKSTWKRRVIFMRSTRKEKGQKRFPIFTLSIIIVLLLAVSGFFIKDYLQNDQSADVVDPEPEDNQGNTNESEPEPEPESDPEPENFTDIRIAAAGDIMF